MRHVGRTFTAILVRFLLALTLVVMAGAAGSPARAASPLRVAVYSGTGADSTTILAMFRAIAAMGHTPLAVTKNDLVNGRLTRANFDVFVIPPGEDGKKCCAGHYSDGEALDLIATKAAIRAYLNSGGGVVAEEAGAFFTAQNGGTLDIYSSDYVNVTTAIGKRAFTIVDPAFGSGSQEAWQSYGGGYFPTPPANVAVVAKDAAGRAAIVKQSVGSGRLILSSFVLELRGDTDLDWTRWDNWLMPTQVNSAGAWTMLGRMIGWAFNGDSSAPSLNPSPLPTSNGISASPNVALIAQHTTDGGAWPGLLPAVARSIEATGNVPLAIRFQDVKNGRLSLASFNSVTFPGGYAYGYKTGLAGAEKKIRDFVASGGGYYGICAGSFYAPSTIVWDRKTYSYPLGLYQGTDVGPINDIATWPAYTLTPIDYSSTALGNLGRINTLYYGGGYHTLPSATSQPVIVAGTFGISSAAGKPDLVLFDYGKGRVALTTTHLEARAGSQIDWTYWDDFASSGNAQVVNPDNPWVVVDALFKKWVVRP